VRKILRLFIPYLCAQHKWLWEPTIPCKQATHVNPATCYYGVVWGVGEETREPQRLGMRYTQPTWRSSCRTKNKNHQGHWKVPVRSLRVHSLLKKCFLLPPADLADLQAGACRLQGQQSRFTRYKTSVSQRPATESRCDQLTASQPVYWSSGRTGDWTACSY
jgi:hypothetical protein